MGAPIILAAAGEYVWIVVAITAHVATRTKL